MAVSILTCDGKIGLYYYSNPAGWSWLVIGLGLITITLPLLNIKPCQSYGFRLGYNAWYGWWGGVTKVWHTPWRTIVKHRRWVTETGVVTNTNPGPLCTVFIKGFDSSQQYKMLKLSVESITETVYCCSLIRWVTWKDRCLTLRNLNPGVGYRTYSWIPLKSKTDIRGYIKAMQSNASHYIALFEEEKWDT